MNKVWFVTGAGRGIGAELVRAAVAAGDRVVASGRDTAKLRDAFADLAAEQLLCVSLNVADADQIGGAIEAALKHFGRIDVLVNNAGYGLMGHLEELSSVEIETQFATNVFGVMNVLRAVLPLMRQQRSGHIMNVSSIAGVTGFPGCSVYCASKYAIEGLSAGLALDVQQFGIHITVVEPGFFRTDFLKPSSIRYGAGSIADYSADGTVEQQYGAYNGRQPGDPRKLGAALVHLSRLAQPPRQYLAGSDAFSMAHDGLQTRLAEMQSLADLSRSTDFAQ